MNRTLVMIRNAGIALASFMMLSLIVWQMKTSVPGLYHVLQDQGGLIGSLLGVGATLWVLYRSLEENRLLTRTTLEEGRRLNWLIMQAEEYHRRLIERAQLIVVIIEIKRIVTEFQTNRFFTAPMELPVSDALTYLAKILPASEINVDSIREIEQSSINRAAQELRDYYEEFQNKRSQSLRGIVENKILIKEHADQAGVYIENLEIIKSACEERIQKNEKFIGLFIRIEGDILRSFALQENNSNPDVEHY